MKTKELNFLVENHKNNLKSLHATLGYDFNAPMITFTYEGNFTMKKILSMCPDDIELYQCTLVVISPYNNNMHCVTFDRNGRIKVDFNFYSKFHSNIDNFYAKVAFEEQRKNPKTKAIVILQKTAFLEFPKAKDQTIENGCFADRVKIDFDGDFTYPEYTIYSPSGCFIARIHGENRFKNAVDKSGYLLEWRHTELFQRSQEYKREKQKKQYKETDNSQLIAILSEKIEEKKKAIVNATLQAKTAEDFKKIGDVIDRYSGFSRAFEDFEFIVDMDNKKEFISQDRFTMYYNSIIKRLYEINI